MDNVRVELVGSLNVTFICPKCRAKNRFFEDVAFRIVEKSNKLKVFVLECEECKNKKETSLSVEYYLPRSF